MSRERQKEIGLKYKGRGIEKHIVDPLIENQVIVELEAGIKRLMI